MRKTIPFVDAKTGKKKRRSPVSKNEMMRSMLETAVEKQHLKFGYVLADSWFSASDNMLFIHKLNKFFVMDFKRNRHCMSSVEDKNTCAERSRSKGQWLSLDKLSLEPENLVKVWIKGLKIEVLLCKLVFTNKDGSTGEIYLVSNDLGLSADQFKTLYQKRWSVEEYHKSLKQNASLAKSPTRRERTQTAHLFASLLAYVKLERLKFVHQMNLFCIENKNIFCGTKTRME